MVAETFVDPQQAQGTCYKATNWQRLGLTAGCGRHARDFYQRHDQPKTIWCLELAKDARRLPADPAPLPPECQAGVIATAVKGSAAGHATCQSLMEVFARVPDLHSMSGRRSPQRQPLAILALDGKVLRGIVDKNGRRLALIALIENQTHRPVAKQATRLIADDEGFKQEGELTAARRLLEQVPALDHAVITGDSMFTLHDIAQSIVADKGGDYLLALKDNNPTLAAEVRARFDAAIHGKAKGRERPFFFWQGEVANAHGRLERRSVWVLPADAESTGLPHARSIVRSLTEPLDAQSGREAQTANGSAAWSTKKLRRGAMRNWCAGSGTSKTARIVSATCCGGRTTRE